jgi:hypothetical protein
VPPCTSATRTACRPRRPCRCGTRGSSTVADFSCARHTLCAHQKKRNVSAEPSNCAGTYAKHLLAENLRRSIESTSFTFVTTFCAHVCCRAMVEYTRSAGPSGASSSSIELRPTRPRRRCRLAVGMACPFPFGDEETIRSRPIRRENVGKKRTEIARVLASVRARVRNGFIFSPLARKCSAATSR